MRNKISRLLLACLCFILIAGCTKIQAKKIDTWDIFTKITGDFFYLPESHYNEIKPDKTYKKNLDITIEDNLKDLEKLDRELLQARDKQPDLLADLKKLSTQTKSTLQAFQKYVDDKDPEFLTDELPKLQKQASHITKKYFNGKNTESMKSFSVFVSNNDLYSRVLLPKTANKNVSEKSVQPEKILSEQKDEAVVVTVPQNKKENLDLEAFTLENEQVRFQVTSFDVLSGVTGEKVLTLNYI